MPWVLPSFAFAVGAIVGSFLNVVIHRYPREESVVFPASHCPHCSALIKPYDNVPILSYIWLMGRCRACRARFSIRYPLVELANALFYVAVFLRTGPTLSFVLIAAVVSMTVILIYIDAEIQILPDVIDLPGIGVGIAIAALSSSQVRTGFLLADGLIDATLGAILGAGLIWAIATTYRLIRKIEGMGMGDLKMMAMIGAVLGWRGVIAVLFVASFVGAAFGIVAAVADPRGLKTPLPFGVFLGLALLALLFFGQTYVVTAAAFDSAAVADAHLAWRR